MTKKEMIVLLRDKYEVAEVVAQLDLDWDTVLGNTFEEIMDDHMEALLDLVDE